LLLHHGSAAVTTQDAEQFFNKTQYNNSLLAQKYKPIWDEFFYNQLLKRSPRGSFLKEIDNEEELEFKHFEKEIEKVHDDMKKDIKQYCFKTTTNNYE